MRVGDRENRIVDVYRAEEVHPDPATRYWLDDVDGPRYELQATDDGDGSVVELITSGNGCDE